MPGPRPGSNAGLLQRIAPLTCRRSVAAGANTIFVFEECVTGVDHALIYINETPVRNCPRPAGCIMLVALEADGPHFECGTSLGEP